ncbi:MAG: hypothetical protein LBQ28_01105 [Prevotellaceae bacterium]|jgi:hypothetical protein|nr:hypothetical protein [Prevotellaceae bacterium]
MKGSYILSGLIGASVLVLVLLAITVWLKPFDYQAVYIVNPDTVITDSLKTDTLTCNQISVLKDLENKGILLTPQEYTSHIFLNHPQRNATFAVWNNKKYHIWKSLIIKSIE